MEKRLTDNEIVKALECCARPLPHCYCDECPAGANGGCAMKTENIIDLINRQKAENERLQLSILSCNTENEKLKQVNEKLLIDFNGLSGVIHRAKAAAYKEFAERLKEEYADFDEKYEVILPENIQKTIADLLRELVGDSNA